MNEKESYPTIATKSKSLTGQCSTGLTFKTRSMGTCYALRVQKREFLMWKPELQICVHLHRLLIESDRLNMRCQGWCVHKNNTGCGGVAPKRRRGSRIQ